MKDWLGLHDFIFYRTRELTSFMFEDTFLESSSNDVAFFLYVLITCLTTFAGIMLSMFMILWIERKFYARVNDRRGATTALRSLWVGENGVTAGQFKGPPVRTTKNPSKKRDNCMQRKTKKRIHFESFLG